ncbi:MAG: TIGR03619 family F420-dependent LLM class oxidoreductase [Acidimicrobiia bacterium]
MSPALRIGAKLPSSGPLARQVPLLESARLAEEAGFDSVWVSDHVVMLRDQSSPYPYAPDGKMTWDPEDPWHDPLIAMAMCAAVTERVEIGVAVLIVPLRNPVILAKQLASLDALSDGRVVVGAGAGWLAEEFDALGTSFQTRGERLDEWIEIMRDCWTGEPRPKEYRHYRIPEGVLSYPTPAHEVPILIGGMTPAAVRRAGRIGDGWVALQQVDEIDLEVLGAGVAAIAAESARAGRVAPARIVMRVAGPTPAVAGRLAELKEVGVTDVVVDVNWGNGGPRQTVEMLQI